MLILQQKKVSPFPKSITPNPLFIGDLKDLQGCGGFTIFLNVGLRCIFQIIFETVYQHEKTKPLKNGTNQGAFRDCSSLISFFNLKLFLSKILSKTSGIIFKKRIIHRKCFR